MYHSIYAKPIVIRSLESAGIKKINMRHGSILPIKYVLTSKDLITMPEESNGMQEAYNLEYASYIGSLIYISYTRPYISFSFNKLKNYSVQPGAKHMTYLINLLC
jgi:hypothetical protein